MSLTVSSFPSLGDRILPLTVIHSLSIGVLPLLLLTQSFISQLSFCSLCNLTAGCDIFFTICFLVFIPISTFSVYSLFGVVRCPSLSQLPPLVGKLSLLFHITGDMYRFCFLVLGSCGQLTGEWGFHLHWLRLYLDTILRILENQCIPSLNCCMYCWAVLRRDRKRMRLKVGNQ